MNTIKAFLHRAVQYLKYHWSWRKALILVGGAFTVLTGALAIIYLLVRLGAFGHIPDQTELAQIQNPAASEVFSADSVLLGRYFIQERSNLSFQDIPKNAIDALIAVEDVRFYEHGAVDYRSFGRVLFKSIIMQSDASGGGSTITQQLSKNLYPRRRYAVAGLLINKLREMIIASKLEKVYSKNEVITLYLNTIPFGDNTFGLEAAAQRFFSKRAADLTTDQAAVLIGMLKATHSYNPRIFPRQSLQRRNVVLNQMSKYNFITSDVERELRALPISLAYKNITHNSGLAPYFRDYIREELLAWIRKHNETARTPIQLYTAGLKIYTTIDSRLQRYAEMAVTHQMAATQKSFLAQWGKSDPWPSGSALLDNAVKRSDHYRSLKAQGKTDGESITAMRNPVLMNLLTPEGDQEVIMSPEDSIKYYLKYLNAGFMAMDPRDGAVRVWVGGINHEYFQYDHVRESTKRQVGSTFKPIVYAAAIEKGTRPCEFISAEKITYTNMEDWAPKNSEENYGLKYSMPGALAYSVNTVSVRVLEKAGMDYTIQVARKLGIKSTIPKVPSLALGSADISVTEMVSAYTAFANGGQVVKPFYITAITTRDNKILAEFKPTAPAHSITYETAQLILHMLRRAVNEGTSASLRSQFRLPNDLAGKTGTTQSNTDGWFMGITPQLVIGAWVGADNPQVHFKTTAMGQGARTALPIVGEFLQLANKDASLNGITRARFPALAASLENKIDCEPFKNDHTLLKRIFGSKKEKKRDFGKPRKKGLLGRILGTS